MAPLKGESTVTVTLSTKPSADAEWETVSSETYRYATVYEKSRRRHWWQFWHSKEDRVVWNGPLRS